MKVGAAVVGFCFVETLHCTRVYKGGLCRVIVVIGGGEGGVKYVGCVWCSLTAPDLALYPPSHCKLAAYLTARIVVSLQCNGG